MSVDKFDVEEDNFRREPVTKLRFEGKFATINMLNGSYKEDHYRFRDERESGAIHPKFDYPHNRFQYLCKRELNKAIKNNNNMLKGAVTIHLVAALFLKRTPHRRKDGRNGLERDPGNRSRLL